MLNYYKNQQKDKKKKGKEESLKVRIKDFFVSNKKYFLDGILFVVGSILILKYGKKIGESVVKLIPTEESVMQEMKKLTEIQMQQIT